MKENYGIVGRNIQGLFSEEAFHILATGKPSRKRKTKPKEMVELRKDVYN